MMMEIITCNAFIIINTPNDDPNIKTICFTSKVTGEQTYVRVMPYMENIAIEAKPIRGAYFISLMADEGFHISAQPHALRDFLHYLIYPENAKTIGGMNIQIHDRAIPDDVEAKLISSYLNVNKDLDDE